MKADRVISARFQSAGYPEYTFIADSYPLVEIIKALAKWLLQVKMSSRITITFARDVDSFDSDKKHRANQVEKSLGNMLDELLSAETDDNDESERQGVVTSHHTDHMQEPVESQAVEIKAADKSVGLSMPQFRVVPKSDSNQ